jgi:hypothetical protein
VFRPPGFLTGLIADDWPGRGTMTLDSPPEGASEWLALALAGLVADPRQTAALYELFGGFCHEYRNLLNGLRMGLYLARRRAEAGGDEVWNDVERRYAIAERTINRFQQLCRPYSICPVQLALGDLVNDRQPTWSARLSERGRALVLNPPQVDSPGAFDPSRLGPALDDLVMWRAAAGDLRTDLRLQWGLDGDNFHVVWDEPPATAGRDDMEDETQADKVLAGHDPEADTLAALSLPLLARVVGSHGGTVATSGHDAWRLTLRWPRQSRLTTREATPCSASSRPL